MMSDGQDDALTHTPDRSAPAKKIETPCNKIVLYSSLAFRSTGLVPSAAVRDYNNRNAWHKYELSCTVSFWQILPRHDQLSTLSWRHLTKSGLPKKKSDKNQFQDLRCSTVFKIKIPTQLELE